MRTYHKSSSTNNKYVDCTLNTCLWGDSVCFAVAVAVAVAAVVLQRQIYSTHHSYQCIPENKYTTTTYYTTSCTGTPAQQADVGAQVSCGTFDPDLNSPQYNSEAGCAFTADKYGWDDFTYSTPNDETDPTATTKNTTVAAVTTVAASTDERGGGGVSTIVEGDTTAASATTQPDSENFDAGYDYRLLYSSEDSGTCCLLTAELLASADSDGLPPEFYDDPDSTGLPPQSIGLTCGVASTNGNSAGGIFIGGGAGYAGSDLYVQAFYSSATCGTTDQSSSTFEVDNAEDLFFLDEPALPRACQLCVRACVRASTAAAWRGVVWRGVARVHFPSKRVGLAFFVVVHRSLKSARWPSVRSAVRATWPCIKLIVRLPAVSPPVVLPIMVCADGRTR